MKKILVTGASGFIGGNIVDRLLRENYKVIATDIRPFQGKNSVIFHQCNLSDYNQVKHLFETYAPFDVVCHQGAFVSVPNSIKDPLENHKANVDGFFNILDCCRIYKVPRLVYASSAAIYNYADSPYGTSKYINEYYAEMLSSVYNVETIGLRYFNVYGRNQSSEGGNVIPAFLKCVEEQKLFVVYNDGNQKRDFVYIDDVVEANICAIQSEVLSKRFSVYDVASGTMTSINDLVNIFKKVFNSSNGVIHSFLRAGEKDPPIANITDIYKDLGFIAKVSLEEGLNNI